jgi:hypothetical protein
VLARRRMRAQQKPCAERDPRLDHSAAAFEGPENVPASARRKSTLPQPISSPELELRKFQVNRSFEALGRIERPVRGCADF